MPEWGIAHADRQREATEVVTFGGHLIPWRHAMQRLRNSDDIEVHIQSLAARLEYFGDELALARSIFTAEEGSAHGFGTDHLVINIRTGDIYRGLNPSYTLLPLSHYTTLIASTGLKPVFVGELHDNAYCDELRTRFPDATFISHDRPMDDFAVLRSSANVVLCTSTFSWMATWLSTQARSIFMPLIGIFSPSDRPDVDLMPVGDPRYRYHLFPSEQFRGTDPEIVEKMTGPDPAIPIAHPRLLRLRTTLALWKSRSLPPGISLGRSMKPLLPSIRRR